MIMIWLRLLLQYECLQGDRSE